MRKSFSHNFLHSYVSLVRENAALCGDGLSSIQLVVVVRQRHKGVKFFFETKWLLIQPPAFVRSIRKHEARDEINVGNLNRFLEAMTNRYVTKQVLEVVGSFIK